MEQIRYFKDYARPAGMEDNTVIKYGNMPLGYAPLRVDSCIDVINDATGEYIYKGLHNKTVIAGSAITAMKLFNLDRNVLDNTPTYDKILGLDHGADGSTYPTTIVTDNEKNPIGSIKDETQRIICGFCVGQGGAGLDISDVFEVEYASWIKPDDLVPFRYPLVASDNVPEAYYKGKKSLTLTNGQERAAYYFKEFSNTPTLKQNYVSTIGSFSDSINASTVYTGGIDSKAQSFVELHLKITKDDCREFFIAHKGLENAKINQLSLVTAWRKTVEVTKPDVNGNTLTEKYEYMQDIRPFSVLNIPNEILSDLSKSLSIIYTLFF